MYPTIIADGYHRPHSLGLRLRSHDRPVHVVKRNKVHSPHSWVQPKGYLTSLGETPTSRLEATEGGHSAFLSKQWRTYVQEGVE